MAHETPYLPPELWEIIIGHLEPAGVKAVRLVSKQCSLWGATFLFKTVITSAQPSELETLTKIANHPNISLAVRQIHFEAGICEDFSVSKHTNDA